MRGNPEESWERVYPAISAARTRHHRRIKRHGQNLVVNWHVELKAMVLACPRDWPDLSGAKAWPDQNLLAPRALSSVNIILTGLFPVSHIFRCSSGREHLEGRGQGLPGPRQARKAIDEDRGKLALRHLLRCRLRYLIDGYAPGSREFFREAAESLEGLRKKEFGPTKARWTPRRPRGLPGNARTARRVPRGDEGADVPRPDAPGMHGPPGGHQSGCPCQHNFDRFANFSFAVRFQTANRGSGTGGGLE